MAGELQIKRGTSSQIASYTGPVGEPIFDTDRKEIVLQDGATQGGHRIGSSVSVIATSSTALTTSGSAGSPRRSTAGSPVTFTLDDVAVVGTNGALIKGPQDITVVCAANVQYGQPGDDFSGSLNTSDFQCQGVMGWELVAIDAGIYKYLITGETSLALSDPLDLESGDVDGVLPEANGGTGTTDLSTAAAVANKLPLAGGAMVGNIAMGAHDISNVGRLSMATAVPRHRTQSLAGGYTLQEADNGAIISFTDAGTLTVPVPNVLAPNANEGFAVLLVATGGDVIVIGTVNGTGTITIRNNHYGTVTARNGGGSPRAAEGALSTPIT